MRPDDGSPSPLGPDPGSIFADWPRLRALDELLAREAGRKPVPPGLGERVYRASVALLPRSQVETARPQRAARSLWLEPLVGGRLAVWGRLAMAASIALAFVVALQFQRLEPLPLVLSADEELMLFDLDAGVERVLSLTGDSPLGDVEHLLLARDMTFRDLASDLALLAVDVEMLP